MLNIIFGFIAGNITGLGMGGGTVLILLLNLYMNIEQHVAQAINLIFFIPTAIASIIINIRQKNIDYKTALIVSVFGIIGAIVGSSISQGLNSNELKKFFALFLIFIVAYEIYDLIIEYKK